MGKIKGRIKFLLFCLAAALIFSACRRQLPPPDTPRPQPAYLHWLVKQAMLSQAQEYIDQVSQSEKVWLYGSSRRAEALLAAAPVWAKFSFASANSFRSFNSSLRQLPAKGIDGA